MTKENLKPYHTSVQTRFHLRGNPFKRLTWVVGVFAGVLSIVWLCAYAVIGDNTIYEGGPLSPPHHFVEQDCRACHTQWAPLHRLLSLDDSVSSIDEKGCLACHARQALPHDEADDRVLAIASEDRLRSYSPENEQSCGACHREHKGAGTLLDVADQFCIRCHQDVRSFEDGHPEFALTRLLRDAKAADEGELRRLEIGPDHGVLRVLDPVPGATEKRFWTGKGQIAFNHDKHLQAGGIRGANGEMHIFAFDCSDCHEVDSRGEYMLAINYERHCADCHPLVFDPDRIRAASSDPLAGDVFHIKEAMLINESGGEDRPAGDLRNSPEEFQPLVVPHEDMQIVRGFLMDFYRVQKAAQSESGDVRPEVLRDSVSSLRDQVDQTAGLLPTRRKFDGPQFEFLVADSNTGCFYCHVRSSDGQSDHDGLPRKRASDVPERWMVHSRFSHASHQNMNCRECHHLDASDGGPVEGPVESLPLGKETSQVLMPSVRSCRQCHIEGRRSPLQQSPHGTPLLPARANCIECHDYHRQHSSSNRSDLNPGTVNGSGR